MLLFPYNTKSAELPAPTSTEDYYRNLVGYTEYKHMYDAFIEDTVEVAADNSLWQKPAYAEHRQHVEQLIEKLSKCAYVQYKLVAIKACSASRLPHVPFIYERMLLDMIFQLPQ